MALHRSSHFASHAWVDAPFGRNHNQTAACRLKLKSDRLDEAAREQSHVKVVSAQDFQRLDVETPESFELRFPGRWIARPIQNRYAAAIERETIAWLASYDIGLDRDEAEKLRKFNCGGYGGYSLPLADYRAALLVTQFISLWLFWDIEEAFQRVVDIHNAEVAEFDRLATELPSWGPATDVLARGWVQAVRHNVYGFTLWESTAERYQEFKAVVGSKALIAPVSMAFSE